MIKKSLMNFNTVKLNQRITQPDEFPGKKIIRCFFSVVIIKCFIVTLREKKLLKQQSLRAFDIKN